MNPDRFKTTITIECFPSTFMELYKKLETVKELVFSPSVKFSVYNVSRKAPNEFGQYYVILEGESVKLTKTDLFVFDCLMRRTVEGFNGMFERIPGMYKLFRTLMKIMQYNEDKGLSPRSSLYSLLGAGNDIALEKGDLLAALFTEPYRRDLCWIAALDNLLSHINWCIGPDGYGMLHFVRITETFEVHLENCTPVTEDWSYYILSSRVGNKKDLDKRLIKDFNASCMCHADNKLFKRLDVKVEKIFMNYELLEKLFSSLLKKSNWERTEHKMDPGRFYWRFKEREVFNRFFEENKDEHHN